MESRVSTFHQLYGHAVVGRYGLGHSLLAWARCWLWCERHGAAMLAPDWRHLRIGPTLRRERDNRQYHRLFRFNDYVTGLRRQWILRSTHQTLATSIDTGARTPPLSRGLVVFSNLPSLNEETHFHEIVGQAARVHQALASMTRPEFRPSPNTGPQIAIHVRMGDFGPSASIDALRAGAKNSRLPVSWYAGMVSGLRAELGNVPAIVYSDGDDASLAALLVLPHVRRARASPSITDMLGLAQAKLLISSGSGFSMWGAYLGDVPRICFPGQRLVRVLGAPQALDREPEVESARELSDAFLQHVASGLST